MQRGAFDVEAVRGYLPGRPVAACVHRIAPGQAGIREVGRPARVPQLGKLIAEIGIEEIERNLGAYLGIANQQA
ncbi:hypothetical protein [Streptomyces sp. NPDC051572]|uniref:hypothetical protein n=1 Tax=unclassified Streptomyces TaxID=2593676 RepID=UPI00344B3D23